MDEHSYVVDSVNYDAVSYLVYNKPQKHMSLKAQVKLFDTSTNCFALNSNLKLLKYDSGQFWTILDKFG